jgi:glycosyltransferase involved in cell wall biosynthesis
MVGDGDVRPRLEALVRRLAIEDAVRWRGWLTGSDFDRRLASADVAVSLDDDDAFSRLSTMIKVPEYLSHGLACVIADLPENRVSAGDAARYFQPGSPSDLAEHLEALVVDRALVEEMAAAARRRAPRLLWSASAPRLLDAYRWLLDGGPPVSSGDQLISAD